MDDRIAAVAPLLEAFGVSHASYGDGLLVMLASPGGGHVGIISCRGDFLVLRCPRLLMVPPARHDEVARLLCKMNFGTLLGTWGLDLDGEASFHVALPLGEHPVQSDIDHLLHSTVAALNQSLPRMMPVAFGAMSASDAVGEGGVAPFLRSDEPRTSPVELEEAERWIRELLDDGGHDS